MTNVFVSVIVSNDNNYDNIIITLCRQTGRLREATYYVVFVAAPRGRAVLVDVRLASITQAPSGGST